MRNLIVLIAATLSMNLACSGTTDDTTGDGGSAGGGDGGSAGSIGGAGGASEGGTGGAGEGGTAATGGGGIGGTGVGPGCAGYGGVGGQPPMCHDGTLSGFTQGDDGYCPYNETCQGDTPVCVPNQYQCAACPSGPGPTMVSIGDTCVDSTEVTREQYDAWLATSPSTSAQPAACDWNLAFTPDPTCMASPDVCTADCGSHPQVCVDWCDASAYCAYAGKRLCAGYPAAMTDAWANPDKAELYEACTAGTGESYPYGSGNIAGACNDAQTGNASTVAVGSLADCGRDHANGRIFDTTGNVWEWEGACGADAGADDPCRARGGSYSEASVSNTCDEVDNTLARSATASNVGFRCCGP